MVPNGEMVCLGNENLDYYGIIRIILSRDDLKVTILYLLQKADLL
jgi:hypothetical protein